MEQNEMLTKSMANLNYFEFYKFRKTFGLAILLIGILDVIFYVLVYYFWPFRIHMAGFNLITIRFILLLIIFLPLLVMLATIETTKLKNGNLVKFKSKIGFSLIIFALIFLVLGDVIADLLYPIFFDRSLEFLSTYLFIFAFIGLYYLVKKIYFPEESNKIIKWFCYVSIVFLVISSLIWIIFVLQYPEIRNNTLFTSSNPFEFLKILNTIKLLFCINGIICGFLLSLLGIMQLQEIGKAKREIYE